MDQSKIAVLLSYEKKKSLSFYPFGNVKTELIQGLKHGFKLQYNVKFQQDRNPRWVLPFWL
jgi:hypothetical protein